MKGFTKFLLLLFSIFLILTAAYFTLLYPRHQYPNIKISSDPIDIKSQITKKLPKKFSLANRELTFDIELSAEALEGELVSRLSKYKNVQKVDVVISNSSIRIFLLQKTLKYIPYEITLELNPKIKDGKIVVLLESSKLGRLNLSREMVLNKVKELKLNGMEVLPSESEIVLDYNKLKDIILINNIKLEDNKLIAELQLEFKRLEDFLKVLSLFT